MGLSTDMLAAVVGVAEQLSISGAARSLGLPKSVVSKRLAQLEDTLGVTLLARSTRSMSLTEAGALYLEFARTALEAVEDAQERLRTLRTEASGLIRVSAPVAWGRRVCAAPGYVARQDVPNTPAELARRRCLFYWQDRRQDRWEFVSGARRVTVEVSSRYRANDPEAVTDAAVAGLGVALLPLVFVEREMQEGRLVRLLEDWLPRTNFGAVVNVVALPDRIRFARNQALLNFLRNRLKSGQ